MEISNAFGLHFHAFLHSWKILHLEKVHFCKEKIKYDACILSNAQIHCKIQDLILDISCIT